MASRHPGQSPRLNSTETTIHNAPGDGKEDDQVDHIDSPEPWKYGNFFPGGYTQKRMLNFKNPKSMYYAINFFAGVAIMYYGYDQGVMSHVNLNPDYQTLMGINPVTGI
ncbi:hypothetical protein MMC18_009107 [Xylographa bjoerkii]|nr:hypothetical protein [Xylographa bjoerkii]